ADAHKGIGRESGGDPIGPQDLRGAGLGVGQRAREIDAEHETGDALESGATGEASVDVGHLGQAPSVRAASLMAARMRTYVAQRQMLPFMAWSMSVSVGRFTSFRSVTALMTWPDWQ